MNTFFNDASSQGDDGRKGLTAHEFLGLIEGSTAFLTPDEFLAFGEVLRQTDADDMSVFFDLCRQGIRPRYGLPRKDKSGNMYVYLTFSQIGGDRGVKLVLNPGMEAFLNAVVSKGIRPDFTLNELIEAAKESSN